MSSLPKDSGMQHHLQQTLYFRAFQDIKEIIFLIQRNQEKPDLQGLQKLWNVAKSTGFWTVCNKNIRVTTSGLTNKNALQWYLYQLWSIFLVLAHQREMSMSAYTLRIIHLLLE